MKIAEVLKRVVKGELTEDEGEKLIEAINKKTSASSGGVSIKLTEKGCAGIRGVRGVNFVFGLSLRRETWQDLLTHQKQIDQWFDDHKAEIDERSKRSKEAA